MACVHVIAADTDEDAQYLATSLYQLALGMVRSHRKPMQPPVDDMDALWSAEERAAVKQMFYYTFAGSTETLESELASFVELTGINEVMVSVPVFDTDAKRRSLELTAALFRADRYVEARI